MKKIAQFYKVSPKAFTDAMGEEFPCYPEENVKKMYETLCGKEEMSKSTDLGDYFRIPADFRDLNYTKYMKKDGPKLTDQEYNSDNTRRLSIPELKELLLSLEYVQEELADR